MKAPERFLDTNVLLYLLATDSTKADRAEAVVGAGGTISVQVLNGFAAVAKRKLGLSWSEISGILTTIRMVRAVQPISEATHDLGMAIAVRYGFSIYAGLILASASLAGCSILHSEDLQDGQTIAGVTVRNPFAAVPG